VAVGGIEGSCDVVEKCCGNRFAGREVKAVPIAIDGDGEGAAGGLEGYTIRGMVPDPFEGMSSGESGMSAEVHFCLRGEPAQVNILAGFNKEGGF
jgi:hypothetical protein